MDSKKEERVGQVAGWGGGGVGLRRKECLCDRSSGLALSKFESLLSVESEPFKWKFSDYNLLCGSK